MNRSINQSIMKRARRRHSQLTLLRSLFPVPCTNAAVNSELSAVQSVPKHVDYYQNIKHTAGYWAETRVAFVKNK